MLRRRAEPVRIRIRRHRDGLTRVGGGRGGVFVSARLRVLAGCLALVWMGPVDDSAEQVYVAALASCDITDDADGALVVAQLIEGGFVHRQRRLQSGQHAP